MPGGKRTRSLAWKIENTRVSHRRYAPDHPAFPHANGFNGFLRALPGDRLFVTIPGAMRKHRRELTPASGRQDHTTSPSAFENAFVFRIESVHRIPRPTSVTIAKRPCSRARDGAVYGCDLG